MARSRHARRHRSQRSEAACDQVAGQPRARGKEQREQVIVGARQRVLAEPSRRMHRPPEQRPPRRFARSSHATVGPSTAGRSRKAARTRARRPGPSGSGISTRPTGSSAAPTEPEGIRRARAEPGRSNRQRAPRPATERATAPLPPPGERPPRDQAQSRSRAAQATRGVAPVTRRRASPRPARNPAAEAAAEPDRASAKELRLR